MHNQESGDRRLKKIMLSHGSGGRAMHELIRELFVKKFDSAELNRLSDSAVLESCGEKRLCFTTDSYVVNPLFFPGGNIGSLAVHGTVNDLSVMGAKPLYISSSFIIEEGLEFNVLEKVATSMAEAAEKSRVKIVTGDTKVVEKNSLDKLFINTSGVGVLYEESNVSLNNIKPGDKIIVNGNTGEHGLAVMCARENIESKIKSDSTPLNHLIETIINTDGIHFMRDPTRGGLATVLNEAVDGGNYGIRIHEEDIPISDEVLALCEIMGFDPLYLANEGRVMIFVDEKNSDSLLSKIKNHPSGKNASIIGEVTEENAGRVILQTQIGGERILDMLTGEQLPRIC